MGILSTLFSRRTCSLSPKTLRRPTSSQPDPIPQSRPTKKPLHALFSEAVGLSPKPTPSSDDHKEEEISSKLKQLEQEIKTKTEEFTLLTQKKMTLFAAFANKPKTKTHLKPKDPMPLSAKNLYPDILKFTHLLFDKGYFNDANFVMGRTQFDPDWFTHDFAVGYIKFAAVRFAKDNQEIANSCRIPGNVEIRNHLCYGPSSRMQWLPVYGFIEMLSYLIMLCLMLKQFLKMWCSNRGFGLPTGRSGLVHPFLSGNRNHFLALLTSEL